MASAYGNGYGGGYQDELQRGPRRKALLDEMSESPDGPSPPGGGGLPASPTPAASPASLAPSPAANNAGDAYWRSPGASSWQPTADSKYDLSRHGQNTPYGYFQYLLSQGIDPKTATDYINESFQADAGGYNFGTGAKFYPETGEKGTIGLPGSYISFNDGRWTETQRQGGGGGGGGPDLASLFSQKYDPNSDPIVKAQRDAILKLIANGDQPVDVATDPVLSAQQSQYTQARRTGALQDRQALAERSAAEGLNSGGQGSGAFDAGVQSIGENASRDIAGNQANLAANELTARRAQFSQALQLADAIGARSESAQLQRQLAQIDAELRKYGLDQQQDQFQDQLSFNYDQLIQELRRDAILRGLDR
jgi:hypothetical protein